MIEGRDFAAASTVGARARQEDDWGTHLNPPAREANARLLAAVADGMGGMPAGDRASGVALRAFLDSYRAIELPAAERLRRALAHANREVGIAAEADPELEGMGCTLVAALFFSDRCEWLSVGDSLILLVRDGDLTRVNPLHVYANELDELVRRGELSEDAARKDPERAALTSAIQGTSLEEVAQGTLALESGDVLMLASDGVLTLTDEEIVTISAEQADHGARSVAQTVIDRIDATGRSNQDNATLVAVCHEFKTGEDTDAAEEERRHSTAVEEKARGASADARKLEKSGNSSAMSRGEGRSSQTTPSHREGRAPTLRMRLFWLAAAFLLGALFAIIGGFVL